MKSFRHVRSLCLLYVALGMLSLCLLSVPAHAKPVAPRQVKVLILSMFKPEAQFWLAHFKPLEEIKVPGLAPDNPGVHCNSDGVCIAVLGMGHANAAASMSALVYSRRFDFRNTYFLIAGIAGIDPGQGTLGSAAWAHYAVDFGIQWELDAREIPADWSSGYLGIHTKNGGQKPRLDYRTEVFELNEKLQKKAFDLSRGVQLADGAEAQAYRSRYKEPVASQPPSVILCDTLSADVWFSGNALGERARTWMRIMTDGKGTYCTAQQEDNATLEVLRRAKSAGLADDSRVAILRTGSDFDRPPEGMSNVENLFNFEEQGGFAIATENLFRAGFPLVNSIIKNWSRWKNGVPND